MRQYITLIIILLLSLGVKAQDYIIESVEHLPTDMTARQHIKKDFKDRDCAVLRFATQGIAPEKRAGFYFQPDFGSDVVEKSLQSGEIWVWVSPNIKVLRVKHDELGSYELHFTKYLPDAVQELHTYKVILKAIVVTPPTPEKTQYNYLIVKADQPGAAISFDGQFVNMGEASKSFKVGETHSWSIECELYHPESGSATIVKDNAVTVEKTLRPAFGYINVTSTPESGANVFVDNKFVGTTPFRTDRIASGEHKIRVMKEMYSTAEKTVTVTDGNTTQATVALSANFVNVTVSTDSDADIYIDSELKGKGRWTGRLSDGSHTFEARRASHRSSFKNVTLTLGRDENITIPNPEPIYGTLDVNSSPMGATIIIDGRNCGTTPKVLYDVLIGSHELRIVKQGCAPIVKTITVKEGQMITVNEKLNSGKTISITTGRSGDEIYIDDVLIGKSPLETAMGYGTHKVKAVCDGRKVEKEINVQINGGPTSLTLEFGEKAETPSNWESNGVNFLLLNGAFSTAPQMSFGLTIGQVKQWGWYASVMTNFNFFKADLTCDENGLIEGEDAPLTYSFKEKVTSRWSVTAGGLCKLGCPLYLYAGVGYGKRTLLWKMDDGRLAEPSGSACKGVSLDAGLMAHIKGFSFSAGVTTIGTGYMEFKVGIGFCLKSRK